jgi:hypothetical protein
LYLGTEGGGVYRLGEVSASPTHISINKHGDDGISIHPGIPNPFTEHTTLNFTVMNSANIQISIYNTAGQRVKVLANQQYNPGHYSLQWNGTNESGSVVPGGIYLMIVRAGDKSQSLKISFIK